MEGNHVLSTKALVDRGAAPGVARSQRWAAGMIGLLLLMTCWGAWVLLIGFRPCALSYLYLFWR